MKDHQLTKPPRWQAIAAAVASLAIFYYIRLVYYSETVVPLSFALPLLLTIWHRDRLVHYLLAISFTAMGFTKVFLISEPHPEIYRSTTFAMMLMNIWTVALVTDWLVVTQARLQKTNSQLQDANAELEASNEELAAREEEISSQNEELQRQTEEMEHQMEELQEQSEELQQQSEELQELQLLAASRERVLQSLFNIATGLGVNGDEEHAFEKICEATADALGEGILGAILLEHANGLLQIRGCCGFDEDAKLTKGKVLDDPFAQMLFETGKTACVEDLSQTPEIYAPQLKAGKTVRAVIGSPLHLHHEISGVILVYSETVREWTQSDFQTTEWLGAQGSLLLGAMNLQAELDRRSRDAEDASHRKTQFLAAVSHDVRTPVNAINLMAEVLEMARIRPELAGEVPDMIGRLRDNTKQLVELVSDVLDISRLDCGKIELDFGRFDFCRLVSAEIQHYQPMAEMAGLRLECQIPHEPIWICTDRMKLIRVVENLLGNAIKFTERGSVVVQLVVRDDGVELHVKDTGVGIPHGDLDHIFDEFFQVSNPERDRSKGTGLGLAICRRLVDALGCSLSVRSQLGQGSTFTIRLPRELLVDPPSGERFNGEQTTGGNFDLSGLRILLVEDHESTRIGVARLLAVHGARVEQAADARSAMQSLRRSEVDVLLLDLMLPDLDGREVLRQLQSSRPAMLKCVLVVSGDVSEQRRQEVLALGADAIVAKPIDTEAIVKLINATLGARALA